MRLKNKKTREIIEAIIMDHGADWEIRNVYTDEHTQTYNSLAELNEEWEDAPEEPKEYWYACSTINYEPTRVIIDADTDFDRVQKDKEIGNYFETMEEAEKAVEKLKAWKRLKDYNVKFNLDFAKNKIDFTYSINNPLLDVLDGEEQIFNNMKIVFGGEE